MKKARLERTFLDELTETSNISIACKKASLSRQTIYRWMSEDAGFRKKVNKAIQLGVESISDLAESKLIGNIKTGNQKSIEYWLNNHKYNYMRPRPKEFWQGVFAKNNELQGGIFFIDVNGKIEYQKNNGERVKVDMKENDPIFEDMIKRYDPMIIKMEDFSEKDNYFNGSE